MARSPWRDALDGQIQTIRTLRQPSSLLHLSSQLGVEELRTWMPSTEQRVEVLTKGGRALAEGLETLIREAEPVHLTHDIQQAIMKRLGTMTQEQYEGLVLTDVMLPIPRGYLWFGPQGMEFTAPGDDTYATSSVVVRGIYFGDEIAVTVRPAREVYSGPITIDVTSNNPGAIRTSMGVVVFLDSAQSGYDRLTKKFGPHIVPVPMSSWPYGLSLTDAVAESKSMPRAEGVKAEETLILLAMTFGYLHALFMLMLQRVTRWGGVGLNREERRDAEREKLRPRVQLVTWRKADYQYPEGHIPVPKNWSCRWSVTEHYRRYKSGKIVKIKSYVKGPPDRPFKLPTGRAHDVRY
jgi:hypothetical protein